MHRDSFLVVKQALVLTGSSLAVRSLAIIHTAPHPHRISSGGQRWTASRQRMGPHGQRPLAHVR